MQRYHNAGGEGHPADTGLGFGRQLYDSDLNARARYAEPHVPDQTHIGDAGFEGTTADMPEYYNKYPAPPVKYSVPSGLKERMGARQAIRIEAGKNGLNRPDPISDTEVDFLQAMQDQAELADFDRYVNKLIDTKRPGMMKVMMEIYPQFVNRRIKQAHTDYEFAMRKQMIDTWGIQTFDDLHFLYLCDQGKISGPMLQLPYKGGKKYTAGVLAPRHWAQKRLAGIKAPYASSSVGPNAGGSADAWLMKDAGNALAEGRGLESMAKLMYADNGAAEADQPGGVGSGSVSAWKALYDNIATTRPLSLASASVG